MINIIEEAKKESARLEKLLRKIDTFLENAPEGCLKWQNKKGKTYYYHQCQNDRENTKYVRSYIKKRDLKFAEILAQKHYYALVKPIMEKQLAELNRFICRYPTRDLEDIYDSLSVERKSLVLPLQQSMKQKIKHWQEEVYEKNLKYSENLKFETEQGELVRSKSEVIIANLLYQNRKYILYKYERPLTVTAEGKARIIYPDFTILNMHTGKIIYWEHAGRMDDPYYANDFVRKINTYILNGFLLGKYRFAKKSLSKMKIYCELSTS